MFKESSKWNVNRNCVLRKLTFKTSKKIKWNQNECKCWAPIHLCDSCVKFDCLRWNWITELDIPLSAAWFAGVRHIEFTLFTHYRSSLKIYFLLNSLNALFANECCSCWMQAKRRGKRKEASKLRKWKRWKKETIML